MMDTVKKIDAPTTESILAARGAIYGEFSSHAEITQRLKDILRGTWPRAAGADPCPWEKLSDHHKEALEMICHKIARILNGDPNYADNWDDIAGYAKLVADKVRK